MPSLTIFDPQIGCCYKAEFFYHLLEREARRAFRYSDFFSVVCLAVNGAGAADRATLRLTRLAEVVHDQIRDTDILGRDGEQLALLLHAPRDGARKAAERVRYHFQFMSPVPEGQREQRQLTVSGGGACFPTVAREARDLLSRARTALAWARKTGGNRIIMADEMPLQPA